MSIMVLGSINMDLTTYGPKLPRPGETLFGTSYITVPGGKGNNQGVAAARMGAEVVFVGRVGADSFGDEVIEIIRREKVDTSLISRDSEHGTGLAVINVDENAQNAIIVISGANMAIDSKDVERAEKALDGIDILMLQLEVPLDASYALAKKAKERGIKVILDPAPAPKPPLADEVYKAIDIITPNETETEALVGFKPQNAEEAAKAAKMLRAKGVETAIIKLGAKGVYFESENLHEHIPIFKVQPIDTVAAGDAFNGGLAVALSEGKDMREAVRWGAAAGAIATTRKGALPAMPYRKEVLELLSG